MTREQTIAKINEALEEIRPFLNSDGGDIAFVNLSDANVVGIKFLGACISCSVNQSTLKSGVEMTIKKFAPHIKEVIEVS